MADNTTNMELMSLRMDNMEKKLEEIDGKLDALTKKLLDPDDGFVTRVNKNTAMRKVLVRAMWIIYSITLGALIKIFTE